MSETGVIMREDGVGVQRVRRFGPKGWYKATVGLSDELRVYGPLRYLFGWDLHDYWPEKESKRLVDHLSEKIPRRIAKEVVEWVNSLYE